MLGYVVIALLAAMGLMSLCWCAAGWLLPVCRDGWLLCPAGEDGPAFVPVYLWLKSLGLVRCPLVVLDLGMDGQRRQYLQEKEIVVCTPEQLPELAAGVGERTIGGRNADHPGRSQRRGVSEL